MTMRRLVVCLLVVVAIAIVGIYHNALVTKSGYELGRLQAQNSRLKISLAALEGRVTQLASPSRLRGQNDRMQLGLVGPSNWQEAPALPAYARLDEADGILLNR